MREIALSTMFDPSPLALDGFASAAFLRANHALYPWPDAFNRIMQVGIYQKGPDVSQVGNTWLENLKDMHALRPFTRQELERLGGQDAFFETLLPLVDGQGRAFSVPWLSDTRLVYYRRDLLAQAGIREEGAFDTPEHFYETLRRLRESGASAHPLAMPTGGVILHWLASWLWAAGGDFRTPDGHRMALAAPEALEGLAHYFGLFEFLHPACRGQGAEGAEAVFYEGRAAVLFSGQWVSSVLKTRPESAHPEVTRSLGQALPPGGIPYLGGSHLVVWRHSLHEAESLTLIEYLLSLPVLERLALSGQGFPARKEAFDLASIAQEPMFALIGECMRRGRVLSGAYRWAAVEMRLNDLIVRLWADLAANPSLDLRAELQRRATLLSERLDNTVLASW